jgi:hypothetical protein
MPAGDAISRNVPQTEVVETSEARRVERLPRPIFI